MPLIEEPHEQSSSEAPFESALDVTFKAAKLESAAHAMCDTVKFCLELKL